MDLAHGGTESANQQKETMITNYLFARIFVFLVTFCKKDIVTTTDDTDFTESLGDPAVSAPTAQAINYQPSAINYA